MHVFLSFPPRFSIAKVVGIFKSISASVIFEDFPGFGNKAQPGLPPNSRKD